jgi:hypothetical protein
MGDDHFTVDDGFPGQIEGAGNSGEALGPVQPVTGEDLLPAPIDVDLDAVAVERDSWIQRSPDGTFSVEVASAGSTNPGKGAFTPIAAAFLR